MSAKHLARIKSLEHKLKVATKLASLKGGDEELKEENATLTQQLHECADCALELKDAQDNVALLQEALAAEEERASALEAELESRDAR